MPTQSSHPTSKQGEEQQKQQQYKQQQKTNQKKNPQTRLRMQLHFGEIVKT